MFSTFTDEQLKLAVGNGLDRYVGNSIPKVERDIKQWEYEIKEAEKSVERKRWLLKKSREELYDSKRTKERIKELN